ncbi:MAG TPA: hypothetical protein PLD62_00905 [Candidatus Cloacimonadota bacterium]|nr:hypothetical protein [Candidatus Cloacimonadota bacterium]
MGRRMKRAFTFVLLTTIGYFAFKAYKFLRDIIELEKLLPQYLKTQFGEKPDVDLYVTLHHTNLTVKFTKETLAKHTEIDETIREFVKNYYAGINPNKFQLKVSEKAVQPVEPKEQKLKDSIQKAERKIASLNDSSSKTETVGLPKKEPVKPEKQPEAAKPKTNRRPTRKRRVTKKPAEQPAEQKPEEKK